MVLKGVQLKLLIGPVMVNPAPREVMQAFTGAQVTQASGQRSGFQVEFTYSSSSPIAQKLVPNGFFDPMNRVIIVATLNGTEHVLSDGPIKRLDMTASNKPGENKLTITGEDVTGYMDAIEWTGMPFPAMPPVARVAMMIAKYAMFGVIPVTIPPIFSSIKMPTDKYAHQRGTDYAYITELAQQAGHEFYITPGPVVGSNTAYWGPQVRIGQAQPALTIDMGRASNVSTMNFSVDGNAAVIPIAHAKIARVSVPIPLPNVSLLKPPLSARPIVPTKTRWLETEKFDEAEIMSRLIGGAGQVDPSTASGTIDLSAYGRPLEARKLVGVRGAGRANDGIYYCRSVTHQLAPGKWTQNFQLARDGMVAQQEAVPV